MPAVNIILVAVHPIVTYFNIGQVCTITTATGYTVPLYAILATIGYYSTEFALDN